MKISKLLKSILEKANDAIFSYCVKKGLILCVVEDDDSFEGEESQEFEEQEEQEEQERLEESEESSDVEREEIDVSIEGEEQEQEQEEQVSAPAWVKELRKTNRESQKRIKELERQLSSVVQKAPEVVELGAKPTLESFEYDVEQYENALEEWHEKKLKVEEQKRKQQQEIERQNKAFNDKLGAYNATKVTLKVKDFDDSEEFVKDSFSVVQQGIIIKGCKNPALVVYALGKNPKKAKEIAAISDPVEYAFAIADLENKLKVNSKKPAVAPERTIKSGTSGLSSSSDSTLDRLREEAEKTGNYSKVIAYKQQIKNRKK